MLGNMHPGSGTGFDVSGSCAIVHECSFTVFCPALICTAFALHIHFPAATTTQNVVKDGPPTPPIPVVFNIHTYYLIVPSRIA